jgi:hypothetical protein
VKHAFYGVDLEITSNIRLRISGLQEYEPLLPWLKQRGR